MLLLLKPVLYTSIPDTFGTDTYTCIIITTTKACIFCLDPLKIYVVRYPSGVKEGDNIQICLQTNWEVVTESVHIYVETTHTSGYTPAIGKTYNTCNGTKKRVYGVLVSTNLYIFPHNSWL